MVALNYLIFPWIKLSWHSWIMWDKHECFKWFWKFLHEVPSSFNPKGVCYSLPGLAICVMEGPPLPWDFSLESSQAFYCSFLLALLQSMSYFFFFYQSPFFLLWLTNLSIGTGRPYKLCYNFSISNDLTQMVSFSTGLADCISHSSATSDLFLFNHAFVSVSINFLSDPKGDDP